MRTILFNHKDSIEDFRIAVSSYLSILGYSVIVEKGGLNAYRILLRNILSLGAGLGNGKDLRDLFLTIQEKVIDPSQSFAWTSQDLCQFLDAVVHTFVEDKGANLKETIVKRFSVSFSRLVEGVKLSCIRLYHIPANFT
jgi:Acidic fibroblast growth factor binding (FIBP)